MIETIQLLAFAHKMRRDTVTQICTKVATSLAAERQGADQVMAFAKSAAPSFDAAAEASIIANAEAELTELVRKVLTCEDVSLNALPELAKAEASAEQARELFANRIFAFEDVNSPDAEVTALRKIRATIDDWLASVERGEDPETLRIIDARNRIEDDRFVAYLDAKNESEKPTLGRGDRLLAKWIGYDAIQEARAAWTAFEDRLPAFQAERQQRIGEIDHAIQARFDKFRLAMRERLRSDLNTAMASVEEFDSGEELRKSIMSKLYSKMTSNQGLITDLAGRILEKHSGITAVAMQAVCDQAKAITPSGTGASSLNILWLKAERFSNMAAHLRGHLAFRHRYNLELDGAFAVKFRSGDWDVNDFVQTIKDAAVTQTVKG
jgi:hypothetical protein